MNAPKDGRLVVPIPRARPGVLSALDARELKRILTLLGEGDDEYLWSLPPPRPRAASANAAYNLVKEARAFREARRLRGQYFPAGIFGEIGWDVLLSLYLADGRDKMSTTRLTQVTGAPMTTVLRWIYFLEAEVLIQARSDPFDGRVRIIELTDKGRGALDAYLEATLRKGEV